MAATAASSPAEDDESGGVEDVSARCKAELDEQIDRLYEKRAATREAAFANACATLRGHWCAAELAGRWETLADFAAKALRRGGPGERRRAAELAELLAVTLGPAEPRLHDALSDALSDVATAGTVVAASAVRALGTLAVFASGSDPRGAVQDAVRLNRTLITSAAVAATTAAAAAESDALLLACWPSFAAPTAAAREEARAALAPLLDHSDVDVRVAAGYALALLFDRSQQDFAPFSDDEEDEDEEDEEDESERVRVLEDCGSAGWAGLQPRVEQLSAGATPHAAKREKVREQPAFKLVARSLLEGRAPAESLTVRFQEVAFEGWPKLLRLYHLRRVLATGLARHLEESDVLADALGFTLDREAVRVRRSRVEKRLERSPCSAAAKGRTRSLARSRDSRAAFNAQFVDGGDV